MRKTLAGAAIAAAGLAAAGAGVTTAQAAGTPRCHAGDLRVGFEPAAGEVGMMKVGYRLSVVNTTHRTCYVRGYPVLRLLSSRRTRLPADTRHGSTYFVPNPGAHKVVLAPKGRAYADLAYAHIREPDTEYAPYLQVTPPGGTHPTTFTLHDPYVWQGRLSVTAFARRLPA